MSRPRAADDFAAIRDRMEQLRRERGQLTRERAGEPSDESYLYPRSRNAEPVNQPQLRPYRDRGRFGR